MTKNFNIFPKVSEDIANLSIFQQLQDQAIAGYAVLTGLVGSRTSASKVDFTSGTYANAGIKKSSAILPYLYIDSIPAADSGNHRYDIIYIDGADNTIKRSAGTQGVPDDVAKFLENYTPYPPQLGDTDWIVLCIICVDDTGIVSGNFGTYATAGVCNVRKAAGMAVDDVTLTVDGNGIISIKQATGSSTGTGSEQTIAHTLGAVPSSVSIIGTGSNAISPAYRADATNLYITISNGETYNWTARL